MSKKLLLQSTLLCLFSLLLSCRSENLTIEDSQQKARLKVILLNKQQIEQTDVNKEILQIQKTIFSQNKLLNKSGNNLYGALIETDKVLLVKNGAEETYTFPISRIYPNNLTENLVLKKQKDGTFAGFLIQYQISKREISALRGSDLKSKMKVFKLENLQLNLTAKIESYDDGCLRYTWETGICTAGGGHEYGDTTCRAIGSTQEAPEPKLMSIEDICSTTEGGSGGGGGTDGGGGSTGTGTGDSGGAGGGSTGSNTNPNLYNTFILTSLDDQYLACDAADTVCYETWQHNITLQQYLQSLPFRTSKVTEYTPTLLTVSTFFKENNFTEANKALMTERLTNLAAWYNNISASQSFNQAEADSFVNWGLQFLLQNPDTSWVQFENWFLTKNEGKDFFYDEDYWEDPNLSFPTQTLPSWNAFSAAYPNQTSAQMYGIVGGEVAQAQIDYPLETRNGCALKVSRALNYSGVLIPNIPGKTLKGADNKYYFLNAKALNAWMRKTFGTSPNNPEHKNFTKLDGGVGGRNFPNLFKDKKGIFSLVSPTNSQWASGHADIMYPNGTCKAGCHFFDGDILYIDFWELN